MGINNSLADARQSDGLFEYLLVGHPDNDVNHKVIAEKEKFYGEHREKIAVTTQPHITIANFLAFEAMEPTVTKWTHQIISSLYSFLVTLDQFSGFPPHTIYLGVQDPIPFQQLSEQLKPVADYIRASGCPPPKLISRPHLSIARRLQEPVFTKAMADYSQRTFHESFMLEELVLLRRRHPFDACKTIQVFRFKPADSKRFSDVA